MSDCLRPESLEIENSSFLITGGTGSFGATMVKKLLAEHAKRVRVYSRDESKHHSLSTYLQDSRVDYQIGDIRDKSNLSYALRDIDYVFHAAALKHVPSSEANPYEYVKTNIDGSHNLLSSLLNSDVKSAVFLSTDKAVYPVNAMGMTKALMEKLVRSASYVGTTTSCITRYGNVIGSRGSIIPLLVSQIKNNQPIKITDWSMTRFVMSLDDSVSLVLHAMSHGAHGDLFIKKAAAANLRTIVESVETLLGKKATQIEITGIRPGEKIHETLLNAEERSYAEEVLDFFRVPSISLRNQAPLSAESTKDEYGSNSTTLLNTDELVDYLSKDQTILKLI